MTLTVDLARELLESQKRLVPPFGWIECRRQDKRPRKQQLEIPRPVERFDLVVSTEIDGGVPRGLRFRYSTFPTRLYSATFQLECNHTARDRSMHILYRMEWRPLRAHTNGAHPDDDLNFRVFEDGETHHHFCLDHATQHGTIRKGDVHIARPINRDLPDLKSALMFVCATLNIANGSDLPEPKAQGVLL